MGGSGGAAQSEVTPASLFPLAVGNRWSYQVTASSEDASCQTGVHETVVVGKVLMGGRYCFELQYFCPPGTTMHNVLVDDQMQYHHSSQWNVNLALPVEEGHRWYYFRDVFFEWHSVGSVTVPAGTFDNCWQRVVASGYARSLTYCPGVGMVLDAGDNATNDHPDYRAELLSFSLVP